MGEDHGPGLGGRSRRIAPIAFAAGVALVLLLAVVLTTVPVGVTPTLRAVPAPHSRAGSLVGLGSVAPASSPAASGAAPNGAAPNGAAPNGAVPNGAAAGSGGGSVGGQLASSGVWSCSGGGGSWGSGAKGWLSFQVAVETSVPVSVGEFSSVVDATLGDYRGWANGGGWGLSHVAGCHTASFTVYLASPWTAYNLCINGGVDIRVDGVPYTDCRAGAAVVINSDRWLYGATFSGTTYRQMIINHEVGHRLGFGHVTCPGPGELAPVMQQQTLDLQGCVANAWPYPAAPPPPPPPAAEPSPLPVAALPSPTATLPLAPAPGS